MPIHLEMTTLYTHLTFHRLSAFDGYSPLTPRDEEFSSILVIVTGKKYIVLGKIIIVIQ